MLEIGQIFIDDSRRLLTAELLPRLRASVERLSADDLWWRPNEASNSVGNLLLHLCGNVRQWIVSGVGGAVDERRRQEEFDEPDRPPAEVLLKRLEETVWEAAAVLEALRPEQLVERRAVQGREVTVLYAVYHVVEHFSMHTGQIVYITKLRLGEDLAFYRLEDGIPRAQWQGS